ncbi:hypothetical protein [Methylosinus sp. LW4]|uniref:hypothetical protein n=1 Tax=Methylosinus sp. LW4 TaxID=136993 RepID=UPI0018DEE9BB|nr:hypothetical protein [Methylosinus sp. LW4]
MEVLRTTQAAVAKSCGLSQPHLSRVLQNKVKIARKTERRLKEWLESHPKEDADISLDIVTAIAARLPELPENRKMQIIYLLRAVHRLMDD